MASPTLRIPGEVRDLADIFRRAGRQCWLVGGAVRDMLMGRRTVDYDVATDAEPAEVLRLFRRVIPTGIQHGTVTVHHRGTVFEVTTFRTEGKYTDGRRPDSVAFVPSIEEDLKRRDFTINALAADPQTGRVLDLHGGRMDLAGRVIRAIGEPAQRFREDGLRLMRACRFAAQLGFTVEERTLAAMRELRHALGPIAPERIREELEKMLRSPAPSTGLELMREAGLLGVVLPELERCVGVEQRGLHCFDVWKHSLLSCDAAPAESLHLRLAALLHDVGKPPAAVRRADGVWTFHGHENVGADIAESLMKRLRFPNALVATVRHLVLCHMFHYTPDWTDAALRRFVARVGSESLGDVLALRRADQVGTCGKREISESLLSLEERIRRLRDTSAAFTLRDLAVSGSEVMEALALKPGKAVGLILRELLEAVLDDPELNEREKLLGIARRFYDARMRTGETGGSTGGASASGEP